MVDKQHLNLVIIGHIDHGKSTMMGALLIETGAVSDREATNALYGATSLTMWYSSNY